MIIESDKKTVASSIESIFAFLSSCENLYFLLPKDKISNWEASPLKCEFKIQGGFIISLELSDSIENKEIRFNSGYKAAFPFTLSIFISELSPGISQGHLMFNAKVSKTIQLIAEKPLRSLFNTMAENLKSHFEV
jgi:hypothetical protein